jgi:molybdopterin-guanine dinucleotide biosynthesis protein A
MIPIAILVGGEGRRLGRPKAEVPVGGVPMVDRVRRAAAAVGGEIITVGKAGEPVPLPGVRHVGEAFPDRCALSGVVASLTEFRGERVLVLACDLPLIEPALLVHLASRDSWADVTLPLVAGRLQPLLAVYGPGALGPLGETLVAGHLGLVRALGPLRMDIVTEPEVRAVDPRLRSFLNVNDEAALREAERRAGENN